MQDKGPGFLLDETPLLWKWIGAGTAMLVGVSGTWPVIVGTGDKEEEWQKIEEWNMGEGELRRSRTF